MLAVRLDRRQQLARPARQRLADRLDLRDAQRAVAVESYSLRSRTTRSSADTRDTSELRSNISRPNAIASIASSVSS